MKTEPREKNKRRARWPGLPAGLLMLVLLGTGYRTGSCLLSIREAGEMNARWAEMENEVEAATLRISDHALLNESLSTLRGWRNSRYDWSAFLSAVTGEKPAESGNFQITRLYFDEQMQGMREQIPGADPSEFYPLERRVDLQLHGVVRAERPVGVLTRFIDVLRNNPRAAPMLETVDLEYLKPLLDRHRNETTQSRFLISMKMNPRELTP